MEPASDLSLTNLTATQQITLSTQTDIRLIILRFLLTRALLTPRFSRFLVPIFPLDY